MAATITAVENVSLDGVMQSPGRADEDTRGGFTGGGWAARALSADPEAAMAAFSGGDGGPRTMLFGHRTYVDLVGHWLAATEPNPFTEVLRQTPKYVVSRDADARLEHPNSHVLSGDVPAAVAALARSLDGEIIILGSGELVRSLARADLIDAYLLTIIPVVLGGGTRLFADTPADLRVSSTYTSPTGVVVATYDVVRS